MLRHFFFIEKYTTGVCCLLRHAVEQIFKNKKPSLIKHRILIIVFFLYCVYNLMLAVMSLCNKALSKLAAKLNPRERM